jgi:hypothetical protein
MAWLDRNFDLVSRIFSVHLRDLHRRLSVPKIIRAPEREPVQRVLSRGNSLLSTDPVRVMRYSAGLWLAYQDLL